MAKYKTNQGMVKTRISLENEATKLLAQAEADIPFLNRGDRNDRISRLTGIIYDLQKVHSGTTAYDEAQRLLDLANKKKQEWTTAQ